MLRLNDLLPSECEPVLSDLPSPTPGQEAEDTPKADRSSVIERMEQFYSGQTNRYGRVDFLRAASISGWLEQLEALESALTEAWRSGDDPVGCLDALERHWISGLRVMDDPEYWNALVRSGNGEQDERFFEEALFLFAVSAVRSTRDHRRIWDLYGKHWRRNMHPAAFKVFMAFWEHTATGHQDAVEQKVVTEAEAVPVIPVQIEMMRQIEGVAG